LIPPSSKHYEKSLWRIPVKPGLSHPQGFLRAKYWDFPTALSVRSAFNRSCGGPLGNPPYFFILGFWDFFRVCFRAFSLPCFCQCGVRPCTTNRLSFLFFSPFLSPPNPPLLILVASFDYCGFLEISRPRFGLSSHPPKGVFSVVSPPTSGLVTGISDTSFFFF